MALFKVKKVNQGPKEWDFKLASTSNALHKYLPNFCSKPSKVEKVVIGQLNSSSADKLRKMALSEFKVIAEKYGIKIVKRKQEKKKPNSLDKSDSIFGVSLKKLAQNDHKANMTCQIPYLLALLIHRLMQKGYEQEGILRKSGNSKRQDEFCKELKKNLYADPISIKDAVNGMQPNDVAGILKQIIQHLPDPLLTNDLIDVFLQLEKVSDDMDQMIALKLLLFQLPEVHRNTVFALLELSSKVAENEASNRMGLDNVAVIMMPNLFVPALPMQKTAAMKDAKDLTAAVGFDDCAKKLTMLMIAYGSILEVVPEFMSRQLDQKESKDGSVAIKVDAPQLEITDVNVEVVPSTTVGEVVEQVCKFADRKRPHDFILYPSSKPRYGNIISRKEMCKLSLTDLEFAVEMHCLYESGGIIKDKSVRHPHEAIMSELVKANPNGQWTVQCFHSRCQSPSRPSALPKKSKSRLALDQMKAGIAKTAKSGMDTVKSGMDKLKKKSWDKVLQ